MISPSKFFEGLPSEFLPSTRAKHHHQVGQSCCCRWWCSIHHKLTWISKEKDDIQFANAEKVAFSSYQAQSHTYLVLNQLQRKIMIQLCTWRSLKASFPVHWDYASAYSLFLKPYIRIAALGDKPSACQRHSNQTLDFPGFSRLFLESNLPSPLQQAADLVLNLFHHTICFI